jgi:hypothetical protein
MGQKFTYNDSNTSLNTASLRLSNVWQNWGYIYSNSIATTRKKLDAVCDDSGKPIKGWEAIVDTILDLFITDQWFYELFVELEESYNVVDAEVIKKNIPENKPAFVAKLSADWATQGFNGTDKYFGEDFSILLQDDEDDEIADAKMFVENYRSGQQTLNEDAPPSPWVIAIGAGLTLTVAIACIIREYKKIKQKAISSGKQIDFAMKKTMLLKAISATATEIQNAR